MDHTVEGTHRDEAVAHGEVIRLANRPKELSEEAHLKRDPNGTAVTEQDTATWNTNKKQVEALTLPRQIFSTIGIGQIMKKPAC